MTNVIEIFLMEFLFFFSLTHYSFCINVLVSVCVLVNLTGFCAVGEKKNFKKSKETK